MLMEGKWKYALIAVVVLVVAFIATHRMDVNENEARVNPLDVKVVEAQD